MKVLCVVGMPGSGKSRAMEFFRGKGVPVVNMGDAVREEAVRRGLPLNPENLGAIARALRAQSGEEEVARRCAERIREGAKMSGLVVIEGIRSLQEVSYFKKNFPGEFLILALHANAEKRYERLRARGRGDDPRDLKEFAERDRRELDFGMGDAIALADLMIVNEGGEGELEEGMEGVYRMLRS